MSGTTSTIVVCMALVCLVGCAVPAVMVATQDDGTGEISLYVDPEAGVVMASGWSKTLAADITENSKLGITAVSCTDGSSEWVVCKVSGKLTSLEFYNDIKELVIKDTGLKLKTEGHNQDAKAISEPVWYMESKK